MSLLVVCKRTDEGGACEGMTRGPRAKKNGGRERAAAERQTTRCVRWQPKGAAAALVVSSGPEPHRIYLLTGAFSDRRMDPWGHVRKDRGVTCVFAENQPSEHPPREEYKQPARGGNKKKGRKSEPDGSLPCARSPFGCERARRIPAGREHSESLSCCSASLPTNGSLWATQAQLLRKGKKTHKYGGIEKKYEMLTLHGDQAVANVSVLLVQYSHAAVQHGHPLQEICRRCWVAGRPTETTR